MRPITPTAIRYIKLGAGGCWARWAFEHGELPFGYHVVPHNPCMAGDWEAVAQCLEATGRSAAKATDGAREIRDFYTLGDDCLWVTMAEDHVWWGFAEPEVRWLTNEAGQVNRSRRMIAGWYSTDIKGEPLRLDALSSQLTQVAGYRGTICSIRASDYLVRRINAVEEPVVAQARKAKAALLESAMAMIAGLHWADFEVMVDLIFARTGWQRISSLGGTLKDIDLALKHPTTGETAFVQVKSRANQAVFDDYLARFKASTAYDRMFFVCHTPKKCA
ncbi:MAG: hypothetical protein U5P41_12930 [Gammaproteobacteria bacterium]|nr:hypothetical protein [Gammaproteobacteria bacterium]